MISKQMNKQLEAWRSVKRRVVAFRVNIAYRQMRSEICQSENASLFQKESGQELPSNQ